MLKLIAQQIAKPLTFLINKSFETGVCPQIFKEAVIKPLFKAGDKRDVTNYRPISLITNFAKTFERILKTRMTNFLTKYKVLSEQQYGFRQGRSTDDAIVHLTTNIYKALNNREPSMAVFVDLAKAFDTVDHAQLLDVLESIGFRGTLHNLMRSYLEHRTQRVAIGETYSECKIVTCGVPQGTVLGPILFNIYLHDLYKIETTGDIISFADDTAIFFKDSNWNSLKNQAEKEMVTVMHYFNSKSLTVNVDKTYYVPFASYSKSLPSYLSLSIEDVCMNTSITSASNVKYLGVYIDNHLRWDIHINYTVKKLRSILYKFKCFKEIFSLQQLLTLYYALVEPHLRYGIIAWGGTTNNYLDNLQKIQKWFLKVIYNREYTYPSENLFNEAKVFDLRQIFMYIVLVRKFLHRNSDLRLQHAYHTRSKENATQVPKPDKTITQRSYYYLGPKLFNLIPPEIKNVNAVSTFQFKIKKWIENKTRSYVHKLIDPKSYY